MRILYIIEDNRTNEKIRDYLISYGHELELMEHPGDTDDVTYMSAFSGAIVSFNPDCVFSTVFYPFLSLACGVSNLRYTVWMMPGYNENNYSYQINNDRDRIYVADKHMYDFFTKQGLTHIEYLPISYLDLKKTDSSADNSDTELNDYAYDVNVISSCTYPGESIGGILSLLKDSTKGYLDGFFEGKKSDLNLDGMYNRFAEYIQDDIKDNYPMTEDSYESSGVKYDNRIFFPHIDRSYANNYVVALITIPDVKSFALYTPNDCPYYNEKMETISIDSIEDICDRLSSSKLTVCLPSFQDGSGLPAYVYELIYRGHAVIMPDILDGDIADKLCIPTFRNGNSYMKIVRKYLNSNEELDALRKRQSEALNNYDICDDPITVLFGA